MSVEMPLLILTEVEFLFISLLNFISAESYKLFIGIIIYYDEGIENFSFIMPDGDQGVGNF